MKVVPTVKSRISEAAANKRTSIPAADLYVAWSWAFCRWWWQARARCWWRRRQRDQRIRYDEYVLMRAPDSKKSYDLGLPMSKCAQSRNLQSHQWAVELPAEQVRVVEAARDARARERELQRHRHVCLEVLHNRRIEAVKPGYRFNGDDSGRLAACLGGPRLGAKPGPAVVGVVVGVRP